MERRNIPISPVTIFWTTSIPALLVAALIHFLLPISVDSDVAHAIRATYPEIAFDAALLTAFSVVALFAHFIHMRKLILLDAIASGAVIANAISHIGIVVGTAAPFSADSHAAIPSEILAAIKQAFTYPMSEVASAFFVFWMVWRAGTLSLRRPKPVGETFYFYLALAGFFRFLTQFRANSTPLALGMSGAQLAGLFVFLAGVVLFMQAKRNFRAVDKHHRILDHKNRFGDVVQFEDDAPTPECPQPARWRKLDGMTAEVEVLEFLKCMVTTMKPAVVVETGTFTGISTLWIAEGLKENGFGRVITCEYDREVYTAAKKRFDESGMSEWIDCRFGSSLELKVDGEIDLLFSDSDLKIREEEVRHFLPQIKPNGVILIHDASSYFKVVREAALKMEREGLISVVLLPTPRGLVVAQKRDGRN